MRAKLFFFLCLTTIFAAPVSAADTDSQIWTSLTATTTVAPQLDATLELHARFTENANTTGQRLVRPSLTYKFTDYLSVAGGYLYGLFNTSTSAAFHEQRIWEQVGYRFIKTDAGTIFSGRTRLEQRFIENNNDTGWRLRQQLRLETPVIAELPKVLLWNETFIGLNDTSWGQRSAFDQTRTFAGFIVPLGSTMSIEPGYLNQVVFRRGEDRMNHVAALNFYVRF